jgi:hypothetical protein
MNSVSYLTGWERAKAMVKLEAVQLVEEGRDPKWVKKMIESVNLDKADEPALADLCYRLQEAPAQSDFAFTEPDDLAVIHEERIPATRRFPVRLNDKELLDRMLGAWVGRCCGCALGKPVEGFMEPLNGLSSKERIKSYLMAISPDEYPLRNYFPAASPAQDKTGTLWSPLSQRENIAFMETDDDIRYTIIGQKILLEKGATFTTADVMDMWMRELPYSRRKPNLTGIMSCVIAQIRARNRRSIGHGSPRIRTRTANGSARKSGPIRGAMPRREIRN